jgi:glyoxylase-like metal-dependent hydrolase (beta-lactamase superfamily II)/ferredoxin
VASLSKKLTKNVEGNYFVDSSCINCDTCREIAPSVFTESNGYSIVLKQPETQEEIVQSNRAIIACPSGSIGSINELDRKSIMKQFPIRIDNNVYYCGFNSTKSYGAKSYYIHNTEGGILIDSPRFSRTLVNQLEAMGGIKYIFLTHRDDVADADKFSNHFNADRIIHQNDSDAQLGSEIIISGEENYQLTRNLTIIPVPGHTKGHMVLLYNKKFLFTGDHLYWRSDWRKLRASRRMCWWDWPSQVRSMKKLLDYDFEWILPGHGHRIYYPQQKMKAEFKSFIKEMSAKNYW